MNTSSLSPEGSRGTLALKIVNRQESVYVMSLLTKHLSEDTHHHIIASDTIFALWCHPSEVVGVFHPVHPHELGCGVIIWKYKNGHDSIKSQPSESICIKPNQEFIFIGVMFRLHAKSKYRYPGHLHRRIQQPHRGSNPRPYEREAESYPFISQLG